jgi:5-methylcytosine-specific restriction endonuclease McrA
MREAEQKNCTYCRRPLHVDDETIDHIPPKAIVPAPARNNIIRVPACRACNNGFARDDEFLMSLSIMDGTQLSRDAEPIAQQVTRWL